MPRAINLSIRCILGVVYLEINNRSIRCILGVVYLNTINLSIYPCILGVLHLETINLGIRCIFGDIRLWVGDPSTSSCRVPLPRVLSAVRERQRRNLADFKVKRFQNLRIWYQDVTCNRSIETFLVQILVPPQTWNPKSGGAARQGRDPQDHFWQGYESLFFFFITLKPRVE